MPDHRFRVYRGQAYKFWGREIPYVPLANGHGIWRVSPLFHVRVHGFYLWWDFHRLKFVLELHFYVGVGSGETME